MSAYALRQLAKVDDSGARRGIDVHKKMLATVVADVVVEGEYQFEQRPVGTSPAPAAMDWRMHFPIRQNLQNMNCSFCGRAAHRLIEGGRNRQAICEWCIEEAVSSSAPPGATCAWCGIEFGTRRPEIIHTFVDYPDVVIREPEGDPAEPMQIKQQLVCHHCVSQLRRMV